MLLAFRLNLKCDPFYFSVSLFLLNENLFLYYLFIYGLFDRDRNSVHRQTENSHLMQISVFIADANITNKKLKGQNKAN